MPRVLELVYTAWDIKAFAEDVWEELRMQNAECRKETGADDPQATALLAEILRRNAECHADAPRDLFPPTPGINADGNVDFSILNSQFHRTGGATSGAPAFALSSTRASPGSTG